MIAMPRPPASLAPSVRRWEKLWNTYIRLPLPWKIRFATHRHWETQESGDGHGPDQFLRLTPTSETLLAEVEHLAAEPQAAILDLGCNVGRHLNALWEKGFRNLHGVDVQHSALKLMGETFPEMRAGTQVRHGTFQEYLPTVADRFFDVTFTHGATIELVPPTYPICREMARVTAGAVVLIIEENGHYYPRLWEREFLRAGFLLTKLVRPAAPGATASLLAFIRLNN